LFFRAERREIDNDRMRRSRVLTIAGSDPSGGAGIQADLATFAAFFCHGMAVVAALTAQDPNGVEDVRPVDPEFVRLQLDVLFRDFAPSAAKTGLLPTADVVRVVARAFASRPEIALVVDPIARSGSGFALCDAAAETASRESLVPLAAVVTPNVAEALAMTGVEVIDVDSAVEAARRIVAAGARAALVKGGHVPGETSIDVLAERGRDPSIFARPRIMTPRRVHGTGCALSAALASALARGASIEEAAKAAGDFVHAAIAGAWSEGSGALVLDFSAASAALR